MKLKSSMNLPYCLDEYKYCPLCSASLNHKNDFIECSKCKHRIFDNPKPCVNLVIENDKKEILLVTRKMNPFKGWLDLPG